MVNHVRDALLPTMHMNQTAAAAKKIWNANQQQQKKQLFIRCVDAAA